VQWSGDQLDVIVGTFVIPKKLVPRRWRLDR